MQKLNLSQLGRLSIEEHRQAVKLPVIVVLDNLRSQHNIGSVFRTADAFRLEGIYLCGITATPPNREMHKTALGATDSVDWKYFESTQQAVYELRNRGYCLVAVEQTDGSAALDSFILPDSPGIGIIFGNEVSGVDQQVIDIVDACLEIPQFGTKHSLNVAVSAGIVIWEIFNLYAEKFPKLLNY